MTHPLLPAMLLLAASTLQAHPDTRPNIASLRYSEGCILKAMAGYMGIQLRPEEPLPLIRYASTTPLSEFQDAIEPQWRQRPKHIENAFVWLDNQIFLRDDEAYYVKFNRFLDDSLAHEYVHYLQARYRKMNPYDPAQIGYDWEPEAIYAQNWFRETFLKPDRPPHPCP